MNQIDTNQIGEGHTARNMTVKPCLFEILTPQRRPLIL